MSKMPQNEKSQKLDYILTFTFMTNMYYIIKQFIITVYSALRLHLQFNNFKVTITDSTNLSNQQTQAKMYADNSEVIYIFILPTLLKQILFTKDYLRSYKLKGI